MPNNGISGKAGLGPTSASDIPFWVDLPGCRSFTLLSLNTSYEIAFSWDGNIWFRVPNTLGGMDFQFAFNTPDANDKPGVWIRNNITGTGNNGSFEIIGY